MNYIRKKHIFSLITIIAVSIVNYSFASPPHFDSERAYQNLIIQCEFGPRNPGSVGYDNCKNWLIETLETSADKVYLQPFKAKNPVSGKEHRLTNIIAKYKSEGGNSLMLCAHWDTRPWADKDPNPKNRDLPILGANDGASGVAILLEIARILSVNPPPRPILIVLFDGEDLGRASYSDEFALGSKYWAEHQIPEPVEQAILLDMVGDSDLEIPVELFSKYNAPDLTGTLWRIADELNLEAFTSRLGSPVVDDHVSLQQVGIEAVDLIDFDYPYWHTIDDTPDKCSAESLDQIGRLLLEYIYSY